MSGPKFISVGHISWYDDSLAMAISDQMKIDGMNICAIYVDRFNRDAQYILTLANIISHVLKLTEGVVVLFCHPDHPVRKAISCYTGNRIYVMPSKGDNLRAFSVSHNGVRKLVLLVSQTEVGNLAKAIDDGIVRNKEKWKNITGIESFDLVFTDHPIMGIRHGQAENTVGDRWTWNTPVITPSTECVSKGNVHEVGHINMLSRQIMIGEFNSRGELSIVTHTLPGPTFVVLAVDDKDAVDEMNTGCRPNTIHILEAKRNDEIVIGENVKAFVKYVY